MLRDKKVLLIGLGIQGGGVSTANYLLKAGVKLTITDLKTASQLKNSLQTVRGKFKKILARHPRSLRGYDFIVQNPAVPTNARLIKLALANHIPVENEASLFFKQCPSSVIAVTGTKGKSTTTALLGYILKSFNKTTVIAGNIRDTAMLQALPKIKSTTPTVLELSSWHLEGLGRWKKSPHIAVITNMLPDHLDRYSSMKQYAQAKFNIFKWQSTSDVAVINYDNKLTRAFAHKTRARVYWFSLKHVVPKGVFIKNHAVIFKDGKIEKLFNLKDIKIMGEHNISNVLAAALTAKLAGVTNKYIIHGIKTYPGLHSRLELIREKGDVKFYNDTTATTPDATTAALKAFTSKKVILIAGGKNKNLKYRDVAQVIKQRVKELILLPGTATELLVKQLPAGFKVNFVASMQQAVKLAVKYSTPGDYVILSPGAASFGLFVNEWDRGKQFVNAVKKL